MQIMEIVADTTNKIAEGEVLQLIAKNNPNSSEANYMQVIENKTAILFQAAAQCGALLANADKEVEEGLREFGMRIGTAFQLIDDVLDYAGDTTDLGKNIGDDLAEGKPTLPLIYALENSDTQQQELIQQALKTEELDSEMLKDVIEIVQRSGGIEYTQDLAKAQSESALKCLQALPDSKYRQAMEAMVSFSVNRRS